MSENFAATDNAFADLAILTSTEMAEKNLLELRKIWLHATNSDAHAIGWLPTKAFDVRSQDDQVAAIYRNSDLVGWCMYAKSNPRAVMKLYQIWVRPDARIVAHGRALMRRVAAIAAAKNCYMIEAWVAEDLPANLFWQAIGFVRMNWRWGKAKHTRKHWRWIWPMNVPQMNLSKSGENCKTSNAHLCARAF